jgi:hypothetical protein
MHARMAAPPLQSPPVPTRRNPGSPPNTERSSALDTDVRSFMEPRFRHDFSAVRVHSGPGAAETAKRWDAAAFTVGTDIVLGQGASSSTGAARRRLFAHELAHVVQQHGATPQLREEGLQVADHTAEREAESNAALVASGDEARSVARFPMSIARVNTATLEKPIAAAPHAEIPDADETKGSPAATVGPVVFGGSENRLPPGQSVSVSVKIAGLRASKSVDLDIEGAGGSNGTAQVDPTLTGSGNVTVTGGAQTTKGNTNNLRVRVRRHDRVIGTSPGFTVAAYPKDFRNSFWGDIDGESSVGMIVKIGMSSDGKNGITDLDGVEVSEHVVELKRDNPPFRVEAGTDFTGGTSLIGHAASWYLGDMHTYARRNIQKPPVYNLLVSDGGPLGPWNMTYAQLWVFKCNRTGVRAVIPNSGFKIEHQVWRSLDTAKSALIYVPNMMHQTSKFGAKVSIGEYESGANSTFRMWSKRHTL